MRLALKQVFFLLLAVSAWMVPNVPLSRAESTYLGSMASPAEPGALRSFSDITLKPIGRVDFRMEYEGRPESSGLSDFYKFEIEGYSVLSAEGDLIRRDDHVLSIAIIAGKKGSTSSKKAILRWSGALLAISLLDRKANLKSITLKLGSLGDPDSMDLPSGASRNQILQLVGPLATAVISAANQTRSPLPDGTVKVGDALLPTSAMDAKAWLIDHIAVPYVRGTEGREPTLAQRRQFLNELPTPRWQNDLRVRGVSRKDGYEYIDYGGFLDMTLDLVERGQGFRGDIRSLIDPFSGIVRTTAAEGITIEWDEDGREVRQRIRMRIDTLVEQRISAPSPQPAQLPTGTVSASGTQLAPLLPSPPPAASTIADIYDRALPSVVTVAADDSLGSGFVIAKGVVVTNEHVIEGAKSVEIVTAAGKSYKARVLSADKVADIAFLQSDAPLAPLPLATDVPRTGEQALVIGSPYGLEGTLTGGLVSSMRTFDGVKHIQIDAPINSGNSGGPVLDASGRVVGMATWKLAVEGFEGLAFAVSALEIRKRYAQ